MKSFVDEALLEEVVEGLDDGGLIGERHREVGIVPAAEDADALELGPLQVHVFLRVLAAGLADGEGVHLQLFAAQLLVYLDLDRQAVAVPAGDVGGVETGHGLGLDDKILDALVECVAKVDGSIGVRRAIVQDVLGGAGPGGANLGVKFLLLPRGQAYRLVDREIGLHGEGGLGQVQGRLQGLGFGHGLSLFRLGRSYFRHWFLCFLFKRYSKHLLYLGREEAADVPGGAGEGVSRVKRVMLQIFGRKREETIR